MQRFNAKYLHTFIFLILFVDCIWAQGIEHAMEEANTRMMVIFAVTIVATVLFLLLIIFRNRYIASLAILSGVALIMAASGKLSHYLLTNIVAEVLISCGYLLIPLSIILGWIYQGHPNISTVSSEDEKQITKRSKKEKTILVVFLYFLVSAVYKIIANWFQFGFDVSMIELNIANILHFLFLVFTVYFYFIKAKAGWILAAGSLLSMTLTLTLGQIFTIRNYFLYPGSFSALLITFSIVYIACIIICLLFVLSAELKDTFKIKRKQLIIALVVGLVLSVFIIYTERLIGEIAFKEHLKQREQRWE